MVYRMSSRTVRDTQRNPVLKDKNHIDNRWSRVFKEASSDMSRASSPPPHPSGTLLWTLLEGEKKNKKPKTKQNKKLRAYSKTSEKLIGTWRLAIRTE